MDKIIYWLKKLGIVRTATFKVKGDASKLNEMVATDGGMIQSQEQIDREQAKKLGLKKLPQNNEKKKVKILFWVFAVLAGLFLLAFLGLGSLGWFVVAGLLWGFFLRCVWKGTAAWTASLVKVLMLGLALTVFSFIFFGLAAPEQENDQQTTGSEANNQEEELQGQAAEAGTGECDDSNSAHADFNGIEKVIISENPCKVPWILAKEFETYTLETKKGTVLQVTVWNNYVNNVKAGESFTIRALDVMDTQEERDGAKIAVVRWVPKEAALESAKQEVAEAVAGLDF